MLPATKPLEMCLYLLKETEIVPWAAALSHLNSWKIGLQDTDVIPLIDGLVRHLISPIYSEVGWEDEGTHTQKLLRKLILLTAVNADMPEAREKALELFRDLKENGEPVSANLRWMAYSAGVKFGDTEEWKFAWGKFTATQVPSERSLWMRSLADSKNAYILQRCVLTIIPYLGRLGLNVFLVIIRYLDATLDRDKIKPQDVTSVLAGVARNPAGSQLAWRHVRMHWDSLLKKFGAGSFIMGSIIESTTGHFSTEFDYDSVKSFFRTRRNHVGSGKRALDQSMEQILINIQWRRDHEDDIRRWILDKLGKEFDPLY